MFCFCMLYLHIFQYSFLPVVCTCILCVCVCMCVYVCMCVCVRAHQQYPPHIHYLAGEGLMNFLGDFQLSAWTCVPCTSRFSSLQKCSWKELNLSLLISSFFVACTSNFLPIVNILANVTLHSGIFSRSFSSGGSSDLCLMCSYTLWSTV